MAAITISSGTIKIGTTVYHGLNYEAWSNNGETIYISRKSEPLNQGAIFRIKSGDASSTTINGVTYSTVDSWIKAFNKLSVDGGSAITSTETITLAGGGNETDSSLTVTVGQYGTVGYQFTDVSLVADCTIDIEVNYDNTNWVTMTNLSGNDVTGVLVKSDTLVFNLVDIAVGTRIRPKFITDTTGDVAVTITA